MSSKNLIFFFACVTAILSTTESRDFKWPGIFKIGEPCTRDRQCIRHAFCRSQNTCLCDTYYAPSLDMATCHVTIGAPCMGLENYHGCETMSNAECRQNVCTCKDNFMIDINNSSNCIIRPKAPGDTCHRTDDCKESMEMAHCIDNKCRCYTSYHFVNDTGTCLKTRGLYEQCHEDHECFLDEKYPNAMECKNGECACRGQEGCNKGYASSQQSFFLVLTSFTFGTICRTLS